MRLQTKIIVSILSIFTIALIFLGLLIFTNSEQVLEKQIFNQLTSVSQINENSMHTFLEGQENKIKIIANKNELSNEELSQMTKIDSTFYDLFIINSSGYVISSSNPERLGLYRGNRSYFFNPRNKTYLSSVYFALVPNEYSIAVSTPFHNGVLVGVMKLEVLDKLVSDRTGLGRTGETLLAFQDENANIVYFSSRRFSNISFEKLSLDQVKNRPIYFALNMTPQTFIGLYDYRNVSVLSVTNFITSLNVAMVTKMDSTEAFSEVKRLQKMTFFLVIILLIIMVFIIVIVSKGISREIQNLTNDIDKITKGDLEIQLKKSETLEINSLIDSLNRILASMKLAILRTGLSRGELGIGEAVKAKEEAEEKYKLLYETSLDARMILEPPTWNFTAGNLTAVRMFNLKDEKQLAPLTFPDLSPKFQSDRQLSSVKVKKMIEKAMKEGKAFFEWTHKRYNGEDFPANVLLSRIDEGGKSYLQATVRDISKEKKAIAQIKDSEEKYRRLFETAQDAILILDAHTGKIENSNPFIEKLLGYSKKELVGKQLWQISPFKNIASNKAKFTELQNKKYVRYENLPLESKSGKKMNVEFVSNVYGVDGQQVIQCNIRDITDRVKAEEELKEKAIEIAKLKKIKEEKITSLGKK